MDDADMRTWASCAGAILRHLTSETSFDAHLARRSGIDLDPSGDDGRTLRSVARTVVRAILRERDEFVGTWDAAAARAALSATKAAMRRPGRVREDLLVHDGVLVLASVRMAHALVADDLAAMHASQVGLMLALGDALPAELVARLRDHRPGALPGPAPALTSAPLAYTFRFPVQRTVGAGATMALGRGEDALDLVDPADAPVVASLRTPDGTWMALRWHEGSYVRPVSAPGTWEPIGVDALVDAVSGGHAWADDPYSVQLRGVPLLAKVDRFVAPWPAVSAEDRGHEEDAARDWRDEVGRLVVVDGIVHRPCPVPVATLARDVVIDAVRLTWVIHRQLSGLDDMSPVASGRARLAFAAVPRGEGATGAWTHSSWDVVDRATSLPLSEATDLRDLLAGHVASLDAAVDWDDPPFVVVRPDLLRPPLERSVEALVEALPWTGLELHAWMGWAASCDVLREGGTEVDVDVDAMDAMVARACAVRPTLRPLYEGLLARVRLTLDGLRQPDPGLSGLVL